MLSQIGTNTTYLRLLLNNGNLKPLYCPSMNADPQKFMQYACTWGFDHQYLLDFTVVPIKLLMKRCHFYIILISSIFVPSRPIVINAALFHTYPTQISTLTDARWNPKLKADLIACDDVLNLFILIIPLEADNSRRISFTYFHIRFRYSILILGWLCNVHASITLVHLIDDWYI